MEYLSVLAKVEVCPAARSHPDAKARLSLIACSLSAALAPDFDVGRLAFNHVKFLTSPLKSKASQP